jgi:L-arabinokinase
MGGIAEHTGCVTLTSTTSGAVLAAVARRDDQSIVIDALDDRGNGHDARAVFPLSLFYEGMDELASAHTFATRVDDLDRRWAHPVAVALHAMLQDGLVPHFNGGLTLVLHSTLPFDADVGGLAAMQCATVAAAASALGQSPDPTRIAALGPVMGARCSATTTGISGTLSSLIGQPDSWLQVRCQPRDVIGPLRLPSGLTVLGIDSGFQHPAAQQKYIDARVAAFMGRVFAEKAMSATGGPISGWAGYLAQITVSDYVSRVRDRIPTKIKGQVFLDRFGDTGCPFAKIDPAATYKVRSRTEHHIYENDRVHHFVERLSRTARTGDRSALIETGELMYASHWSYGQRCGLGTVATDLLVNRLRECGPHRGVFGARVSGRGAGGVVVAMIEDSPEARAVVRQVVDVYQHETGHEAQILEGSSPGALVTGVRPIR